MSFARPSPAAIMIGDMIVDRRNAVGLVVDIFHNYRSVPKASVIYVNNGRKHPLSLRYLRRATQAEISKAGLEGVGCNEPPKEGLLRRRTIPGCPFCEAHSASPMMPYHDAAEDCESSKHPHCTCDLCF